jgi:hypothetical protein
MREVLVVIAVLAAVALLAVAITTLVGIPLVEQGP